MDLRFNVESQHITRTDRNIVVAKSQNYLKAKFDFSPDWAGKTKTAVFNNNGHVYNVILDNDECFVAEEVIRQPGFTVSVFGGDLITADVVMIRVEASGYEIGGSPEPPTPEVYEQVLGMFDKFRGGDEGQVLAKSSDNDLEFEWVNQTGGGGGGTAPKWGDITGILSNQADLQAALDAKENAADAFDGDYNNLTNKPPLFSGDYNDLINKPEIPQGITEDAKNALLDCFAHVAWSVPNGQIYSNALEDALNGRTPTLPELIAISASKEQTSYAVGDTLSLADVIVTATYSDDTYADVTEDAIFDTADVDMDVAGTYSIGVSYEERGVTKTTSISITIAQTPVVELTSISATKTKTSYTVGDTLDTNDIVVTASYNTGTTADVTSSATINTSNVNMAAAGTYNITISYTENGITKTTAIEITVASSGQTPRGQIPLSFTSNKQLSRFDGTIKSKDNYACTEAYTSLVDGMVYTITSSTATGNTVDIVFYTSSKAYIGYVQTRNGTVNVPDGASYVRIGCYPTTNASHITFTESAGT